MTKPKLRVLLDLSMAVHATSGIPQDARLLYKTLAACDDLDVTGLVYNPHGLVQTHKFLPPGADPAERLANQSKYLWYLAGGVEIPRFRSQQILKFFRQLVSMTLTRRAQLEEVDMELFAPVIWRLLFQSTLSPDDYELVRRGKFLLSNLSGGMIAARVLTRQTPVRLDTRGYDFLIAQGSRPLTVSPGTQKIVRYHDMIPVLQPDTRPHSRDIGWHHTAIKESIGKSFYVCNSDPTREDLIDTYPELTDQSETIPYVLSERYWPDPQPQAIEAVIGMRRSNATGVRPARSIKRLPRFLMCVSTLEPRKNFIGLIQAFNTLKMRPAVRKAVPNLKLLLVGSPGWRYEPTLNAMRELVRRGDLIHLEQLTADELRLLYTHAEAFVFPSHAEGFGFPPVEAMRCGTPVIASDIPAHRWVLGDAALYCNSYDVRSIADAVERLVASPESTTIRAQLIQRGRQQTQQFTLDRCMGQWHDLLMRLKHKSPPVKTAGFDKPRLMQEAA